MTRLIRTVHAGDIRAVCEYQGLLCLELPHARLPLYHYAPLRLAHACGQSVPFASEWAEHLKPFVYDYAPVPTLHAGGIPDRWKADFASQERPSRGLRPGLQATFRGWPLYLYLPDQIQTYPTGNLAHLFQTVTTNLKPLTTTSYTPWGP